MLNYAQKSRETFCLEQDLQFVNVQQIDEIKRYMLAESLEMFRLCLHQSEEEQIQSMVLFFKEHFVMDYLWQDEGYVQYQVLGGCAELSVKTTNGVQKHLLGMETPIVRFHASTVRKTVSTSDFFVFCETQYGPFRAENTKRLAGS